MNQTDVDDALHSGRVTITEEALTLYILKHGHLIFKTSAEAKAALPAMIDAGMVTVVHESFIGGVSKFKFTHHHSYDYAYGVSDTIDPGRRPRVMSLWFNRNSYLEQELMKRV